MERITVTVDDELKRQFDAFMAARGYSNRSEAFRDLLRRQIDGERLASVTTPSCVGCLTYVYGHAERELPRRLVEAQHSHHDLSISTLHLHLDHENCMEAMILRGRTEEVVAFAGGVIAQRGVRHGHLWLVPVELRTDSHHHGAADAGDAAPVGDAAHVHTRPTT